MGQFMKVGKGARMPSSDALIRVVSVALRGGNSRIRATIASAESPLDATAKRNLRDLGAFEIGAQLCLL